MTTNKNYLTIEDFLHNAQPCPEVGIIFDELQKEQDENLIDPHKLRTGQDWGYLAGQIVGGEIPPEEYTNN